MTSSNTSIGPGPQGGGNESHGNADGLGNKTLGEGVKQAPEAGAEDVTGAPGVPASAPGAKQPPGNPQPQERAP